MKSANSKRSLIIWLGLGLSVLLLWLSGTLSKIASPQKKRNTINEAGGQLYTYMSRRFPVNISQFITAQAAHETDNFSSPLYYQNKNLFGMTYAGQKLAYYKNGYAAYDSYIDSMNDYLAYYKNYNYHSDYKTVEEFIASLALNGYFTAPYKEYLAGVKHYLKIYFNEDTK